jgi:beta-fructofuranosidase
VEPALLPSASGWDDLCVWTGSVVGRPGDWRMFYTGRSRADGGANQQLGLAVSPDLHTWARVGQGWPLQASAAYEWDSSDARAWRWQTGATSPEQHFRDPWAISDADGRWHLYVTARLPGTGPGRATVGHVVQHLDGTWEVVEPLTETPGRFEQTEVIQVVEVEGRWVLLFSCLGADMSPVQPGRGGVWSVPVEGVGAPVDLSAAVRVCDERWYAGRLVRDRSGAWQLLAFVNQDDAGRFVGGLTDPMPVRWRADARGLELVGAIGFPARPV